VPSGSTPPMPTASKPKASPGMRQVNVASRCPSLPEYKYALPAPHSHLAILPRANDQFGTAVTVHVASIRRTGAKTVPGTLAREREQSLARPPRIHIDPPRRRPVGIIHPVGSIDVADTITVHVTHYRDEHFAQRTACFICIKRKRGLRRQTPIYIDPTMSRQTRRGRSNNQKMLLRIRVPGDCTAKAVTVALPGQGLQQRAVPSGVHVGMPGIPPCIGLSRSAYDHIRVAVSIQVTDTGDVVPEQLVLPSRMNSLQDPAIAPE